MNRTFKYICLFLLIGFAVQPMKAQRVQEQIRQAAVAFKKQDYKTAKSLYQSVTQADSTLPHSYYGLGCSHYALEEYDEALKSFRKASENSLVPHKERADIMHNIGNCYMKKKDYHKSVAAYKQSLRMNPNDDETRYNLALAMKLAKNQQDDSSEGGQSPNPSAAQAQKREVDKVSDPKETRKGESEDLSKDAADKILDAYKEDEQKTREKVERMKQNQSRNKNEKNKKKW